MAERTQSDDGADYAALVRGLLDDLKRTSITRLDLRHGGLKISLQRTPGAIATAYQGAATETGAADEGRPAHWHAVAAPLTGIFYTRPSPDEEPYIQVGSHIEAEGVLGLIETMKMFNEVTSEVAGTVREILLENGSLVQSGQIVVYIEPGESAAPTVSAG